ncbi:hypothetical protein BASA81_008919 [Batrachochytrium salamandrivorans]|nr:hypothetical protein BASA81_008919 [Batrachochytrium salamandrivorans]
MSNEVDDKYARFLSWLEENGAVISPSVSLFSVSQSQRGVKTKQTIAPQTTVVAVPLNCLITDYMGRTQTKTGKLVFSQNPTLSAPALLSVSEELRDWLQGSPLIQDVEDRMETMEQDYEEICRLAGPIVFDFTFQEFLSVRTCVGSRNFGIQVDGQKRTTMVPFADMLNHLRPRQTSWTFDAKSRCFTITSLQPILAGSEVMDSYGKKDNARFLLHYGFAIEGNREEDGKCPNELLMQVQLQQQQQHPMNKAKLALLGQTTSRYFKLTMHREDKETGQAIGFARILVANDEEILQVVQQQASTSSIALPGSAKFISLENELRALHSLVVITGEQEICSFWMYLADVLQRAADFSGGARTGLLQCAASSCSSALWGFAPPRVDEKAWGQAHWDEDCAKHADWLLLALADLDRRNNA